MESIQFHDFQLTKSTADMRHYVQQNGPMNPSGHQHHDIGIYQHMKDLQQIV